MNSRKLTRSLIYLFISYLMRCQGDDSPGFFLRITKNIPRLGRQAPRQTDAYDFYGTAQNIKQNEKNIDTLNDWLWDEAKLKRPKRVISNGPNTLTPEHELSIVQPINANANTLVELIDRQAIPNDNVKFIHWKDFDLALQLDSELYEKVMSLGRRPDQHLKDDLTIGIYASSLHDPKHSNFHSYNDAFAHFNQLRTNNIY